ncbi:hypothetical protein CcI49_15085 [Frankia sp. CcI49]|uniref:effector-associated domain EAD1-containing protein n=1 Tax=unclassified Frankia TaxID=2632575 RepID=UPI0006CA30B9|nr:MULTISPECIES: effector-associated domain EAD1-containing protein [unclassified Frankia]KPM52286.1 hypothetical protein ACG83_28180 [Frankia sp. R43]ONH60020.1 hypothetical protein CcI49_15085 [Frankia sp. CcI49]
MGGRPDRLTEAEVTELARVLYHLGDALGVLDEAGADRSRLPHWQGRSSLEFWREINVLLDAGFLADGRRRILTAAARRFPVNEVFGPGADLPPPTEGGSATEYGPMGMLSTAQVREFVLAKFPPVQLWNDTDSLVRLVSCMLLPGETPFDIGNGVFGRSTPGSGVMLLTDRGITLADRTGRGALEQVVRFGWPLVTEVRLLHRRRVGIAVSDVDLAAGGSRILFRGMLRAPALRMEDQIRRRISRGGGSSRS